MTEAKHSNNFVHKDLDQQIQEEAKVHPNSKELQNYAS